MVGRRMSRRGIEVLSDWEMRELQQRAKTIIDRFPPTHRQDDGRYPHLRALASEYDVSLRTVYRYLRRAA